MDSQHFILYYRVIKATCHLFFLNLVCKWKLTALLAVGYESTAGLCSSGPSIPCNKAAL